MTKQSENFSMQPKQVYDGYLREQQLLMDQLTRPITGSNKLWNYSQKPSSEDSSNPRPTAAESMFSGIEYKMWTGVLSPSPNPIIEGEVIEASSRRI